MTGPLTNGEDVALFIDWENFKISLATGRRTPNVSALKEEVSNLGRVVVAKAYADWVTRAPELRGASQFINDPPALYAAGIEPVYVPTRLPPASASGSSSGRHYRVKNSVDVKMTADCIECAHSYPNIGHYVLVSGDSDFIHVVNTLRTMGKRVVIIGVSWATSRRLADQVDGLILYDVDVDPVTTAEPVAVANGRGSSRLDVASRQDLSEVIREIEEIVRTERQAGGTPLLTSIKQRLMRRFPKFDEKHLGFAGFKKLMARVAQEGNVKLITAGLVDWATMADEPTPSDAQVVETGAGAAPLAEERQRGSKPIKSEEPAESQPTAAMSPSLETQLAEATAGLDLPEGPGDGQDAQRMADLIVMADTLEHREGISHVAFNFLVAEVCQALEQGLEAEHGEITQRWTKVYSRAYVSKMFRGLSSGNLFLRGWHSSRDETSGQQRRRRTFNLDRDHPVVQKVLKDRWSTNGPTEKAETLPQYAGPGEPLDAEFSLDSPNSTEASDHDQPVADTAGQPATGFFSRLFRPRSE